MVKWWRSLSRRRQYGYAMLSAGIGYLPLLLCQIFGWPISLWWAIPCMIVMMNGACLAYAIRVSH